jgi:peptidoglycan/LPS O-acetylase OafA/YrhL
MARPPHLPALDGLRGLAILLVIAHNAQMLSAPDMSSAARLTEYVLNLGWIGVQLFFVLSGFLITGILLDSIGRPHALRDFMARRALRIFPLYYGALLLIFVLLPAVGLQAPRYQAQAPYQAWLWAYLSNWTDPLGIGPSALPHFWSLAVEEQFYLVWPLLVFGLRSARAVAWASLAVALLGMSSRAWMLHAGYATEIVYSWTICRIDALAWGGLAAALWRLPTCADWIRLHALKLGIGLVALTVGTAAYTHAFARTSPRGMVAGYTVLAIVFAAVIYRAAFHDSHREGARTSLWQRFLSMPALQSVGKYSYGMYVIHKPLLDLLSKPVLTKLGMHTEGLVGMACLHVAGVMLATFGAAWVSYNLYEVRFLRLKRYFA